MKYLSPALLALPLLLSACGGGDPHNGITGGGFSSTVSSASLAGICDTLDNFVSTTPEPNTVPGYSFALFDGRRTVLTCSGGNQTLDSTEPIASSSKLPSAAAIMSLADDGLLNLDTPVANYLSGSAVTWPSDKAAITTRMLLAHTSGLPGLGPDDSQPACLDNESGTTMAACVSQIAAMPLVATPGTTFNYGGADYQVAGYVATLLAGEDWEDLFQSRIGEPLGLSTYTYGNPATVTNPRVAGGATSNVADYVKILQLVLNKGAVGGVPVLLNGSINTLETNQIAGKSVRYAPTSSNLYPGYTFGSFISADSLHPGSPGPEFSDPGLFGTTPWIDTGLGYGAVILINRDTPTGLAMWNAVRPAIISALTN